MTDFQGQVNPTKQIHTPPPAVKTVNRLTAGQIGAFGTIIVDLILAQVAFALGGVDILGLKPFAFLTDWGNQLVKQAEDAYKNSFVIVDVVAQNPVGTTTTGTLNSVYSAAAAVRNTATTADGKAETANGNVQTTWNALWDGAKGTTGSTAKTASDVKAAVLDVRNTGISADGKAQDTIDGVYSAVMGGEYTGLPANYVKPALTGLTYTARNNVATGTNLVIDPGADYSGYWSGQAGVAQNTNATYARTGSNSVSLTSAGSTARTLFFNTIDTGVVQAYFVRQSEIYYVECWLYSATAMGTVQLVAKVNGSTVNTITSTSMSAGTWIKLSGQYTIPVGVNTASFGIQLAAGATTNGSIIYVDDMLVREITNAQTAQTNVESTWNQIYNGVYNLNLSGRSLTDVFNALFLTKQTADGGVSAAGTAQGTAETASGKADTASGKADTAQNDANGADLLATIGAAQNGGLVQDPNFDDDAVRRAQVPGYATVTYTTEQKISAFALKVTCTKTNAGVTQVNLSPISKDGVNAYKYPVVPGQVYKFDVSLMAKTGNVSTGLMGIYFACYKANGTGGFLERGTLTGSSAYSEVTPTKGTWQRLTGTFTVPSTTGSPAGEVYAMAPAFAAAAVTAGDIFYIGRALIYRA